MKLGMAQGIGDLLLTEAVEGLQTAYPLLDLQLRTDWSGGLCQQISDGALDAPLILLPSSSRLPTGMVGRCLGSVQTVIVQDRNRHRLRRPIRLAHLAKEEWVLNPLGCGYRAALKEAMGERSGPLHVAIDTYGTDVQLRLVAAGGGLGLVPRVALKTSSVRDAIAIVEVSDFSLSLDAWLIQRRHPGNLRKALEVLAAVVSTNLERTA